MIRGVVYCVILPALVLTVASVRLDSSRELFERRILPILKSPNPSSCSECHLSGVDLKDYVRPSEAETFASLREQRLIDLENPGDSKLLKLIKMSSPKSTLVKQRARDAEYEAFKSWIEAGCSNPALAAAPAGEKPVGPAAPNAVIRHSRIDLIVESFVRNVWSQQGRCMGCHTRGTDQNRKNIEKFGDRVGWCVPNSPEETMQRLLDQKLINVDDPENSLFLLKPLNKVPHGGGVKFMMGDAGYKQFRAWIEDYARCVKAQYRAENQLPVPDRHAYVYTDCILVVSETPESWGDRLLRVDAYAWDSARGDWTVRPVATGDRQVSAQSRGTNIWMWLIPPRGSAEESKARRNPRLTPGKYLLKYYSDTTGKLDKDFTLPTDSKGFFQGQQEISSDWTPGWGSSTKVRIALSGS